MKVGELIAYVNAVKGREFPPEVYDVWLNEVEGLVQTRIHLIPDEAVVRLVRDAEDPTAFDETVLSAPFPYDKLYAPYIEAKVDFANGEYDRYENSMAMFDQFSPSIWRTTHRPFVPQIGESEALSVLSSISDKKGRMPLLSVSGGL